MLNPRTALCGLSLIEVMVTLAVVVVLAALSLPNMKASVLKARRSEALTLLGQVELAQARHRSQQPRYASLAQLGLAPLSPNGHYRLSEATPTDTRFSVLATAQGAQNADFACRHLQLTWLAGTVQRASGPTTEVDNDDAANRRCWGS